MSVPRADDRMSVYTGGGEVSVPRADAETLTSQDEPFLILSFIDTRQSHSNMKYTTSTKQLSIIQGTYYLCKI